ncbi:MAG: trehalose-phosphatase [Chloroflexota bacterium]|nr:trehalose-phosphatase [Chloroflexota bacterium]
MSIPDEWRVVLDVLREKPAGLFTDIDGTISPIAPTPGEARVLPEAAEALAALVPKLSVVGAVTGRATQYAYEMVGVPGMLYTGNHGLEEMEDGVIRLIPEAEPYAGKVHVVFEQARPQVSVPGLLWEDKGITGSVHYRQAPDKQLAEQEIVGVLRPLAEGAGMRLYEGRMIVELRPALNLGKGAAIRRLVERQGLRGCAFLGDDITDTEGFRVLREMREAGRVRAVCVGVLSAETPPAVLELADVTVEGVPAVAALLEWLSHNL